MATVYDQYTQNHKIEDVHPDKAPRFLDHTKEQ